MLDKLQQFFHHYLSDTGNNQEPLEHRLQLACAVLMVEMIYVDNEVTETEQQRIRQLLHQEFSLAEDETESLLELATDRKRQATDYYAFTSLLNKHYTQQQKTNLIADLWSLAYADGNLDKYEEHLVRRLADLLHVPHHSFIKTKYEAC